MLVCGFFFLVCLVVVVVVVVVVPVAKGGAGYSFVSSIFLLLCVLFL